MINKIMHRLKYNSQIKISKVCECFNAHLHPQGLQ
jgi:hypothetical protein